jgi:predicted lactoylglutathione lyase
VASTPEAQISAIVPTLTVDDLEKSIAFYQALGFSIEAQWDDGSMRGVMLRAGTTQIGLNQDNWQKGRDRVKGIAVRLSFSTTTAGSVDAIAKRARDAGISLQSEPLDAEGFRAFELIDPSGFLLTVYAVSDDQSAG